MHTYCVRRIFHQNRYSCAYAGAFTFRTITLEVHRGQSFSVPIKALGQMDSSTAAIITVIVSKNARLDLNQSSQTIPRYCTNITFNLYSTEDNEELILYPDGPCRDTGLARVHGH